MYLTKYDWVISLFFVSVTLSLVTTISVSSNGNSPETKMFGGMVIDVQKGFVPMESKVVETQVPYERSRNIFNSTKLSINERYRRLIPYMTFYYANDLTTSTPHTKNFEIEKAEVVEANRLESSQERQPKRIVYSSNRNIPRYEGNRLTQYNIASANPTKVFYKDIVPVYQTTNKQIPNYNPLLLDYRVIANNEYEVERPQKFISRPHNTHGSTRKPYLNLYNDDNAPNIGYYLPEKDPKVSYKLVPYEQTPPIKTITQTDHYYQSRKPIPVPVLVEKDQVYLKPRLTRPQYIHENMEIQSSAVKKQPPNPPQIHYEKQRPQSLQVEPVIESGFKPITDPGIFTTEAPAYTSTVKEKVRHYESQKQPIVHVASESVVPIRNYKPSYYQHPDRELIFKPYQYAPSNAMSLSSLVSILQRNKSLPKPITKENVGSSIKTLLQVLNAFKIVPQQNDVGFTILTTAKPVVALNIEEITEKTQPHVTANPISNVEDFHEEHYLAPVHTPSQHLDGK